VSVTSRETRIAAALGVALFLSYAYFYGAGGWNQNSRFALIRAILERHTLQIDAYQLHTGDRAFWRGHYYTDKAPGASLLALAPVQAARLVSRAAGVDPASFPGIAWTSYVAGVVTSGVFTVIAALCVFWLSLRWGATTGGAIFAATGYGIASPAWAYATLFMGHGQTAGCLMIALVAADALDEGASRAEARNARTRTLGWVIGLAGGWAVVTEFQAAIPAIFIGLLAIARDGLKAVPYERDPHDVGNGLQSVPSVGSVNALPHERDPHDVGNCLQAVPNGGSQWPLILRIAGGVTIAAIPLLIYNVLAFGSPFHIGYASEEGFQELHSGFFGITYPSLSTLRELLFGAYRGLLPLSPLMATVPVGLVLLGRKGHAGPALVAGGTGLYYLLLNASYFYWEGGWAFGPRQMTAALPFLALGLAPLWDCWRLSSRCSAGLQACPHGGPKGPHDIQTTHALGRTAVRSLLLGGWIWGVGVTLIGVSTTPQPPASFKAPVRELLWPAFRDGDLSLNPQTFVHNSVDVEHLRGGGDPHAAWNLGELAGLRGLPSLLPLLFIWVAAAVLLFRP
jgi:hypothetical protein